MLGINKLRNAALSMSVARMWSQVKTPPGWSTANFNQHSVGVGILSDLLAQRLNVEYAEGAFAAGLFHDLGLLLVAIGMHDEYKQLSLLCQQSNKWAPEYRNPGAGHDPRRALRRSAGAMESAGRNPDCGALPRVARSWIRRRWKPGQITLSRVLNAADRYVKGTGVFVSLFESPSEDRAAGAGATGIGERLPVILSEFDNEFTAIKSYF